MYCRSLTVQGKRKRKYFSVVVVNVVRNFRQFEAMLVPSTSNCRYSAVFNIIGMKYKATLRYWSRSFRVLHSSPHMFPWLHKCLRNTIFTMFETHEFHVPEIIFTSAWDNFHKCLRHNFHNVRDTQFSHVSETHFSQVPEIQFSRVSKTIFTSVWDNFYKCLRHKFHKCLRHSFQKCLRHNFHKFPRHNFHKCLGHNFHKCLRHNFQKGLRHSFHKCPRHNFHKCLRHNFHKCLRHTIFNDVRPLINAKCDDREAKLRRHSCGIWRHVVQCRNTDVSEESSGPIYRVVTANRTWNHTCFLRYS